MSLKSGFLTLFLLLLTLGVFAQNKPFGGGTFYTVSGNVQAEGANLAGATVVLLFDGSIVESTTTDAFGDYSLNALESFSYTASVYKDGHNFNPSHQNIVNIQSNQTVNFQNGIRLCIPAPFGQTGENFCQDSTVTPRSVIDNGKIAFEIFGNAFAVNADGTNQMQVPPAGSFPSWSFDGTKLLSNRTTSLDPDQEIYITNADSSAHRQITFNFVNDYKAKFSPDGTRAVFYRLFNTSNIQIFTINTDSPNNGINEIQLTNDTNCINQDPVYSPDGAKIAFSKRCEDSQFSGIYTMNTDGSAPFQLTSGSVDLSPTWRPDGSRIVFIRDGNLWFVNASGSSVVQMTFAFQPIYFSPVYSPDGTKIAFSRSPDSLSFQEIYTFNPETTEEIRLTTSQIPFNKEYPSWQRILRTVAATLQGGLSLTFTNVTNGGNSVATPIELNSAGALPSGFQYIAQSVAYDVRTSANYTGEIEVCFDLPGITDENLFNSLVIFHNENGELVDRTTSRDFPTRRICATTTNLSPFVVAAPLAPLAANVSIAGRVLTNSGESLRNAVVVLTDSAGVSRSARTNAFGYFRFEEVEAGQNYIIEIRSKQAQFNPQIIAVSEDITDLEFIAIGQNQ